MSRAVHIDNSEVNNLTVIFLKNILTIFETEIWPPTSTKDISFEKIFRLLEMLRWDAYDGSAREPNAKTWFREIKPALEEAADAVLEGSTRAGVAIELQSILRRMSQTNSIDVLGADRLKKFLQVFMGKLDPKK